ncbi:hypothetical protein E2562_035356 [Oryza meyeriana var. granulata]|uniref:non-specific serine/threonine protein kinase n=1 Tax=Oryza meyeriana var. granulata TaxID=110450 RepID=A0A6G1BQH5_9ORYZ|nr:hypothetical protein E2562_035356 [Oryza meyeriana var. granulata]
MPSQISKLPPPLFLVGLRTRVPIYGRHTEPSSEHRRHHREQLDWSSRFRIIQGVTQGITYLHTHSEKRTVVHLDLKPDNILLDSDMNPKIGDFGLAKVLEDDEINASVCGTLGYMPPEYIVEGVISVKNDVYGFGVTLLETISGMSESGRGARHQASIEWNPHTVQLKSYKTFIK